MREEPYLSSDEPTGLAAYNLIDYLDEFEKSHVHEDNADVDYYTYAYQRNFY